MDLEQCLKSEGKRGGGDEAEFQSVIQTGGD